MVYLSLLKINMDTTKMILKNKTVRKSQVFFATPMLSLSMTLHGSKNIPDVLKIKEKSEKSLQKGDGNRGIPA